MSTALLRVLPCFPHSIPTVAAPWIFSVAIPSAKALGSAELHRTPLMTLLRESMFYMG